MITSSMYVNIGLNSSVYNSSNKQQKAKQAKEVHNCNHENHK